MIHPIRPTGPAAPVHPGGLKNADNAAQGAAFAKQLQEVAAGKDPVGPVPADPKLAQVRKFAAQALGTETWEARLVESYDALSADEGLYEVQTSKGPYQVIRSRMGSLSIYPSP